MSAMSHAASLAVFFALSLHRPFVLSPDSNFPLSLCCIQNVAWVVFTGFCEFFRTVAGFSTP